MVMVKDGSYNAGGLGERKGWEFREYIVEICQWKLGGEQQSTWKGYQD